MSFVQKLEFFEIIYSEEFWKFFMVLKYYGKLDFANLEYPKSSTSLHISKTVADCNIVCENVLFGYLQMWTRIAYWLEESSFRLVDPYEITQQHWLGI